MCKTFDNYLSVEEALPATEIVNQKISEIIEP